ncbi:succinate-semialdehyde dehydrogenase/glutarate-semialdehyde dehydrogenase [Caldalkalibacillus uzonensis]|uniref:Succinate-semialdehyde dehydrogenase/glutarate-semialdehyde dehydrogenase n=1 Tax=Caldalkalibacillus uzonensis TaxID=353224 RepID=A0ABU0CVX2_9BACI|nr:NAD-dependent succinate-semialdehyde dehydrogenase [Caldalkalibacillus uzonensis]MDQ0340566.1 succinate-semialdehyde dehydrogenase/glutarate-semialdehyde dehydrogenase [Caldalkalibacillus uzonensis]
METSVKVRTQMYIDGQWTEACSDAKSTILNPATGEVVAEVAYGGAQEAQQAVEAAYQAFPAWANSTADERAAILRQIYHLIIDKADRLAEIMTLEQGKPFEEAKGEVLWGAEFMLWYAEEARRVYGEIIPPSGHRQRLLVQRQPIGVVGAITPWNFPSSMITRKLAPALAAGCTVVVKPAPETPLSAIALFEIFEQAGLPRGVANLVLGDAQEIGSVLVSSEKVRKISFTGSTQVGKYLMEQSAKTVKKVSLELGGHAPYIVFNDADLDLAVDGLMINKFQNNGQTCICANRIFVHSEVADAFTVKLVEKVKGLKVGNGLDPANQVGPLIHQQALEKVMEHVQDAVSKGAVIVAGGQPLTEGEYARGNFYQPTVLCGVTPDMKVYREETFGPVAPIIVFNTDEEVVQMANDTPYGLAAYLYTRDLARTMRVSNELEYGMVGINASTLGYVQAPFGGIKQSGMGREGGRHGLEDYLEYKFLNLNF